MKSTRARQAQPAASAVELATLAEGFERPRRRLAAARRVRDVLEGSAGPLVCLGLALLWWRLGKDAWPIGGAIALVLVTWGLSLRGRLQARRARLGADAPLLVRVEADIAALQSERRRLLTMRSWHLGPVVAALLLSPALLAVRLAPLVPFLAPAGRGLLGGHWFGPGYFLLVSGLAFALNRREVRLRINPRLDELEALRRGLLADA